MSRRLFWLACFVGLLLRVAELDNRTIHHDEAVNWFLFGGVLRKGFYAYDPTNYHGPLHFYIGALGRLLLGESLAATRLPVALAGAAVLPSLLLFKRYMSATTLTIAAWLLALSPTMVFHSRYAIHEMWLVLGTVWFVAGMLRWLDGDGHNDSRGGALLAAFGFAVMLSTKETTVLTGAALAVGCALSVWRAGALGRTLKPLRAHIAVAGVTSTALIAIAYTGFRNLAGLGGLATTLGVWGTRGVQGAGHDKPFWYFGELLLRLEAPIVLLALVGAVVAWQRRSDFGLAVAGWGLASLVAYSAIPYKTPWCVIQITLPLVILAAIGAVALWERVDVPATGLLTAVVVGLLGVQMARVSFVEPDDERHGLAYVHTHREYRDAIYDIRRVLTALPDAELVSYFGPAYPFNWSLRDLGWTHRRDADLEPIDTDLVLVARREEPNALGFVPDGYSRREFQFRGDRWMVLYASERASKLLTDEAWQPAPAWSGDFTPPQLPAPVADGLDMRWYSGRVPTAEPHLRAAWVGEELKHPGIQDPGTGPVVVVMEGALQADVLGTYGFSLRSDDGSRLWIDGALVVDNWGGHPVTEVVAETELAAGGHHVRLVWFDHAGRGLLDVRWTEPGSAGPRRLTREDLTHDPGTAGTPTGD